VQRVPSNSPLGSGQSNILILWLNRFKVASYMTLKVCFCQVKCLFKEKSVYEDGKGKKTLLSGTRMAHPS